MSDESPVHQSKFSRYRQRKTAMGLRELRMWVPDIHSPQFKTLAAKEADALRGHRSEKDALDFIEAVIADNPDFYD